MEETQRLAKEFFDASRVPATTHEEWLLRQYSSLMQREAKVVSIMERHARRGVKCKETCAENSNVSTGQCTETAQP